MSDNTKIKSIAIIPARGGSKRIPRKNIRHFFGKPIIAYSIEMAIQSQLFDEVMVSTDDPEIAEIAKIFGAKVPFFRSDKNSNDYSGTFDVIEEVLMDYEKINKIPQYICCIYPCAPFIKSEQLKSSFEKLISGNFETVFPIVRYSTPIQRALQIENNLVSMIDPQNILTRTQDLTPSFFDAGMFYWCERNALLRNKKIISTKSSFIEIPEIESQDIDNENDWEIAELKYELLQKLK